MNARRFHPVVIEWLCIELLSASLRHAWGHGLSYFESFVNATDCYPCRVCWETGDFKRFWIEIGPSLDDYDFAEGDGQ